MSHVVKHEARCLVAVPGGQKVGPYVEGLVGELEEAQDAVRGRAAGVSVAGDDAVLVENLQRRNPSLVLRRLDSLVRLPELFSFFST